MNALPSRYWERFDFFLSAFLNAARSIDYRLRHERGDQYRHWREAWNAKFSEADALTKFMVNDRRVEVHDSGSGTGRSTSLSKSPIWTLPILSPVHFL